MCPDPQLLSIYMDGELPSPWKEKMESHLAECSACREKLENFNNLREALKKNTHQRRTIVELSERAQSEQAPTEQEFMERAKSKIWKNLEAKQRFRSRSSVWRRSLSIPLPAAAAAALVIMLLAGFGLRGASNTGRGYVPQIAAEPVNFFLTAEDEMGGFMPVADMNGVLQYLGANDTNIIILQLPESKNFSRSGEPAIIRAADYTRR